MAESISTATLCDRYAELYTGAITDVLDERGLADQTLSSNIRPLKLNYRMAGIAYPVVGRPNRNVDPDDNIENLLKMFGQAPPESILISDTNDSEAAHIGELSVTALAAGGCRGAVVDGGTRDVQYILERDFPVFTRYCTPADGPPRWEVLEWDVDTIVDGVPVSPGDIVVGDADGVVIVPESIATEVLLEAEKLVDTEDDVRQAILDGQSPLEAYNEHGVF